VQHGLQLQRLPVDVSFATADALKDLPATLSDRLAEREVPGRLAPAHHAT